MKPHSMTVKEWLIKSLALSTEIPEKVIDAVVSHQFQEAHSALEINDSVEISGFGKFFFNRKKLLTKIKRVEIKIEWCKKQLELELTEKRRHAINVMIVKTTEHLKTLNNRNND